MRKILMLSALLIAPGAQAQEGPALSQAVVAVVDLTRVSEESAVGRELASQLGALQAELEASLVERRTTVQQSQTEFQASVDAFQAERDTLSEDAARARENELMDRQQALQELIQAVQVDADGAQRRLQGEVARLTAQLDQDIRPHINAVAEEMGVDVLLPISQTVFVKADLDLTDRIIARVDASLGDPQP